MYNNSMLDTRADDGSKQSVQGQLNIDPAGCVNLHDYLTAVNNVMV